MTNNLINRIHGYTDKEMYDWCRLLKDTMESTVKKKVKSKTGEIGRAHV